MIVSKGPIRILMVGRHYWPHLWSDVANRTVRLACGLARAGVEVEVLTPRYASSWPDQICHREIVVNRPAAAPRSDWSMGRYLRHVESWLRQHADRYDVIYSATMREEASLVVEAARRAGRISIVHHSGTGQQADTNFALPVRHRRRVVAAVQAANAIVLTRASTHQAMLAAGYEAERLHRIAAGVSPSKGLAGRDAASRERSRQVLASINGDLKTDRGSMVAVVIGAMVPSSELTTLAEAIPHLINLWPDLRFWLIGDGPMRNDLHRYFKQQSVRQNVAMPGTFVDFSDVLMASDVYIQPSANDGLDSFVPQAIAASLPMVMVDAPDTRAIAGAYDECIHWCSESDSTSLHHAVRRVLGELAPAQNAAERLRRELVQRQPFSETVNGFVTLLNRLLER